MSPELHPCTASSTLGSVTATLSYTGLRALYQRAGAESHAAARPKAWTAAGSPFSGSSEFLSLLMVRFGWGKKTPPHTQRSLQRLLMFVSANVAEVGVFSSCSAASEMPCLDDSLLLLQPAPQISPSQNPLGHLENPLLEAASFFPSAHLQHLTAAAWNKHPVLLQKTTSSFQSWVTNPTC